MLSIQSKVIDLDCFDEQKKTIDSYPGLTKLIGFEVLNLKPGLEPPSIKIMQAMELAGYEPASDSGHFRFYPNGSLMLKLLEDWAEEIAIKRFGAMQIETPVLYDWSHEALLGCQA
jgi:threonyl-tRNA synthetase